MQSLAAPEARKAWDWLMEQGQGSAQLVMLPHMADDKRPSRLYEASGAAGPAADSAEVEAHRASRRVPC